MKINEKHLVSFATGNSPADKEGFLSKRGEVNKSFQKRWFALKGNLLFYFEKRGDRDPIGVIILEGCTVELAENTEAYTFELVFQGAGSRTYVLAAETQEEMENWMKAIACGGYDYMKLMVMELQKQLDEINAARRLSAATNVPAVTANLLDLDIKSQGQTRFNPFDNTEQKSSGDVDAFGAVPFNSNSQKQCEFKELHEKYGLYIEQKMAAHTSA
ncbi:hypothetical protein CAPTEDRAFT_183315 [Capitella teleta]|uniref:PH domain-containing protein n=1 Tax=Capitella teleta TaxID=283909 RepID=R7VAF3_CAPTE|nr:hypothetical protein CAPTEDRAFT_183315 [Capitella teleta]|eukprot:ELU15813.1 hypothetical protein CAPTEDRAFT_183315 [Capitella teleta]